MVPIIRLPWEFVLFFGIYLKISLCIFRSDKVMEKYNNIIHFLLYKKRELLILFFKINVFVCVQKKGS